MKKNTESKLIASAVSLLLAALFFGACLKVPPLTTFITAYGNLNILTFAGTTILFCLAFLLIYTLLEHKKQPFTLFKMDPIEWTVKKQPF